MNSANALACEPDSEIEIAGEFDLSIEEEPEVAIYVSTPESGHTQYKHAGSYCLADENYWIEQHKLQAGEDAKVMSLPFYDGEFVDSNGTPVTA